MAFVLDASAALPWCFRDEATSASEALRHRAEAGEEIFVPAHWPIEILSALTRAARRRRTDDLAIRTFLTALLACNLKVSDQEIEHLWSDALPLIQTYTLSAYDAAYLALAKRLNVPLATFDDKLTLSARIEGIALAV
jgi:predicted nucleic acid-binding protein